MSKINNIFYPEECFVSLCSFPKHKENALKLLKLIPTNVKEIILSKGIHVTDFFNQSINPDISIDGECLGYFINGGRAIYLIPKNIFSDDALVGLMAHELAHAYIFLTSPLKRAVLSFYYRIKIKNESEEVRFRYKYYNEKLKGEEYYADCLVRKWGLESYQKKLWVEEAEKMKKENLCPSQSEPVVSSK